MRVHAITSTDDPSDRPAAPALRVVAEDDDGTVVARAALDTPPAVFATAPDELAVVGWSWTAGRTDAAGAVVRTLLAGLPPGQVVTCRTNAETHPDSPERVALLDALGFGLYQEKRGFFWHDGGQALPAPGRVRCRPLAEAGTDVFTRLVAECHEGSLDRHDRHRARLLGADHEARLMLTCYDPAADRGSWLVADVDGDPVGFVAVGAFDDDGLGTIVYIGVRPGARGRGYVDDLLRTANLAARERGMHGMLSDVDTGNHPMAAALVRAGHHPGRRPWHVWHHRRVLG